MTDKKGKIGVIIEEYFGELEYQQFNHFFPRNGYEVEYISHLWKQKQLTFKGHEYISEVTVKTDFKNVDPTDYKGILLIGGYAMDRLRYQVSCHPDRPNQSPAVEFLRKAVKAMDTDLLKIGTICHGLWLFCAAPELLKGRRVTCIHNIIDDVKNAGGAIVYEDGQTRSTCIDGNLITARHPGVIDEFLTVFLEELEKKDKATKPTIIEPSLSMPTPSKIR
jgi:protease I